MRQYLRDRFYVRGWTMLGLFNTLLAFGFNRVLVIHRDSDTQKVIDWHIGKGTDFPPAPAVQVYKILLNTIVEPITHHDEDQLRGWVVQLKQSDGEGWAVGEMLERALGYIMLAEWLWPKEAMGGKNESTVR